MRGRLFLVVGLLLMLAPPADAELIGEGVNAVRCTEQSDVELPKTMEFTQTISSDAFEIPGRVVLGVDVDYNDEEVKGGKVVVIAYQLEADGSESKLGRIVARLRNGAVEKFKMVEARISPGQRILWRARLRGFSPLVAEDETCWELGLFVVVADQVPG